MNEEIFINKLVELLPTVEPQRYDGNKYIVYSEKYGFYTKKEAEAICYFINHKLIQFLTK
jgi:hypothetical protein